MLNFNKKHLLTWMFIGLSSTVTLVGMEQPQPIPQRQLSANTQPIQNNDANLIRGFVHYLTQKFNHITINVSDLHNDLTEILTLFNQADNLGAVCFYSYLYLRKYFKENPTAIGYLNRQSDLLYFIMLVAYLADKVLSETSFKIGDIAQCFHLDQQQIRRNLLVILDNLDWRTDIGVLKTFTKNPPTVNPDPRGDFATDARNPYGDINGHYVQLLTWGTMATPITPTPAAEPSTTTPSPNSPPAATIPEQQN